MDTKSQQKKPLPQQARNKFLNRWWTVKDLINLGIIVLLLITVPVTVRRIGQNTYKAGKASDTTITIEAEKGSVFSPAAINKDGPEVFVQLAPGAVNYERTSCILPEAGKNAVVASLPIEIPDSYRLWAHVQTQESSPQGVLIQIDTSCAFSLSIPADVKQHTWAWVLLSSPETLDLSAGVHSLKVFGKYTPVKIDKIILTTNKGFTPTP